jgi:rare lipoprotein A (peptidoglycan hydrolase)
MAAEAAAVMRRARGVYAGPRSATISAVALPAPPIAVGAFGSQNVLAAFKLAAGTFACAGAMLAILAYQGAKRDITGSEPIRNETIVLRHGERMWHPGQSSGNDRVSDGEVAWNNPRAVATVRFIKPDANQILRDARESTGKPSILSGRRRASTNISTDRAEGIASWYGPDFHGKRTANGERYDMHGISAAHRTMPLPSYARVTNLDNGRSIIVRVNNRGPFMHNRIVDLSVGTAKALDFYRRGTAHVRVEFVGRAPIEGGDNEMLLATLRDGTPAPVPASVMVASAGLLAAKTPGVKQSRSATDRY